MRYEYKQIKYRSEDGRFDGSLNTMAGEGWKVESIDRIDGIFLVTYSRVLVDTSLDAKTFKTSTCSEKSLDHTLHENRHHRLIAITAIGRVFDGDVQATMVGLGVENHIYYTIV